MRNSDTIWSIENNKSFFFEKYRASTFQIRNVVDICKY